VITFQDPRGKAWNRAFAATPGGTITFQGPADWALLADQRTSLCSRQPIGAYTWSTHPSTVTPVAHDDCAERDAILTGTWKRT
jgi:hypothetical protein